MNYFILLFFAVFFFLFFKIVFAWLAIIPEAIHFAHSINEIVDQVGVEGVQKLIEGVQNGAIN